MGLSSVVFPRPLPLPWRPDLELPFIPAAEAIGPCCFAEFSHRSLRWICLSQVTLFDKFLDHAIPRSTDAGQEVDMKRSLLQTCMFLVAISLNLTLISCQVNPATGAREIMLISEEQEIAIGANARPYVEAQYSGLYQDARLEAYVQSVGMRVARVSHRPHLSYKFSVLNTSVANAFALPGGYIYITRGLLTSLQNEAQLAAVLGHEIGHITAKHGLHKLQRALGFQFLVTAALAWNASRHSGRGPSEGAQNTAIASTVAFNILTMKYSRDDEYQADRLGAEYAFKAGYNPMAMVELLRILKQMQKREPTAFEEFFSTHPRTEKRIAEMEDEIRTKFGDLSGLAYGQAEFEAAVASLRQVQSAYEVYDQAEDARAKGHHSHAIALYDRAIGMQPDQSPFYVGRGVSHYELKRMDSAEQDLRKAVLLDPELFMARFTFGQFLLERRAYREAISELSAASNILPEHALCHFFLARALDGQGDIPRAIHEYRTALSLGLEEPHAEEARRRLRQLGY